jgi:hypothetical protein
MQVCDAPHGWVVVVAGAEEKTRDSVEALDGTPTRQLHLSILHPPLPNNKIERSETEMEQTEHKDGGHDRGEASRAVGQGRGRAAPYLHGTPEARVEVAPVLFSVKVYRGAEGLRQRRKRGAGGRRRREVAT